MQHVCCCISRCLCCRCRYEFDIVRVCLHYHQTFWFLMLSVSFYKLWSFFCIISQPIIAHWPPAVLNSMSQTSVSNPWLMFACGMLISPIFNMKWIQHEREWSVSSPWLSGKDGNVQARGCEMLLARNVKPVTWLRLLLFRMTFDELLCKCFMYLWRNVFHRRCPESINQ